MFWLEGKAANKVDTEWTPKNIEKWTKGLATDLPNAISLFTAFLIMGVWIAIWILEIVLYSNYTDAFCETPIALTMLLKELTFFISTLWYFGGIETLTSAFIPASLSIAFM